MNEEDTNRFVRFVQVTWSSGACNICGSNDWRTYNYVLPGDFYGIRCQHCGNALLFDRGFVDQADLDALGAEAEKRKGAKA